MDFDLLLARWTLRLISPAEVPEAAVALMMRGFDSPAVVGLAVLESPTAWEVDPAMDRACEELTVGPLSPKQAAWRVAYGATEDIVSGAVTPLTGARTLWQMCTELDMPEPLRYFVYLAADYGEGPSGAAWFDARIRETAEELLASMPTDKLSAPLGAA